MRYFQFHGVVAHLVSKVAERTLYDVDSDFSPRDYFDDGAETRDQLVAAHAAAVEVLEANGFQTETVPPVTIDLAERFRVNFID